MRSPRSPSPSPSPAVVVGIDGSRSAINAALWAVDEAVSRDIPLRLVYAIEPRDTPADAGDAARDLAAAEVAIRAAVVAVESTDSPVKIEVEIAQGHAVQVLRNLSYSAQMLCLGVLGMGHATGRQVGSTTAVLADTANCPVAVIREGSRVSGEPRQIVAEVDDSPGSHDVLDRAVAESLLRKAPLSVLTAWQSRGHDRAAPRIVADNKRIIRARQERLLAQYRVRHPGLNAQAVAAHCDTVDYLARNAAATDLIVTGRRRNGGLAKLLDPAGHSAFRDMGCSVLICPASRAL